MINAFETEKRSSSPLRRLALYLRVPIGTIALAGLALSAFVHTASLRGVDVEFSWPNVWLLHYALFPVFLLAVVTASQIAGTKRLGLRDLFTIVPWWALALFAAALVYVLATFLLIVPASGAGDPLIKDGRFFFNDHGIIREVTEDQFHFQRSISLRLFSSVWIYLYLFSAIYLLGARRSPDKARS